MAVDSAESPFDPFRSGDQSELGPESRPLQVSTNTQLESGIPPARPREELSLHSGEGRLELALAGVTRNEASLGQLVRGLKHLATGALAAQEANTELMRELDELRTHLVQSNEEEVALRYRMSQLEQLVNVMRHEFTREREFLIEQQDLFLIEILTDHERQVDALQQTVRGATSQHAGSESIAELTLQRDQAREYATRCERERDLAWRELGGNAPTLVSAQTPDTEVRRPSGSTAIGSIQLKTIAGPASSRPDSDRTPTGYSLGGDDVSE